jgi:hypothetical protein
MKGKLETIPEIEPVTINIPVDSNNEIDNLNKKMENICRQTAQEFFRLKSHIVYINDIFEKNYNSCFMNENFDKQEQIEEQIDSLIFEYKNVKNLLRKGRDVKCYKEEKEKEKRNELRYARNVLASVKTKK